MNKHARRHRKAKMIRAAEKIADIRGEEVAVEWIEAAADDTGSKAKKFKMCAYSGGPMFVSSYGPAVVIDLDGLTAEAPVPILMNHDHGLIVGHADEVKISGSKLNLSGLISGAGPAAEQVLASSQLGFPWKASVGARPDKLEFVAEDTTVKVNGKSLKGPLYVARKATLKEVSFVAVPADSRTTATVAATAAENKETPMEPKLREWIVAAGLNPDDLREDQVVVLKAAYQSSLKATAREENRPIEQIQAKAPAFDLRGVVLACEKHAQVVQASAEKYTGKIDGGELKQIQAKAAQDAAEIKAKALNEEWSLPKLEVALVKASADVDISLLHAERPKAPAIHASSRDMSAPVIEAAFGRTCGLAVEKHYKPEVLEASAKLPNFGLQELLLRAAAANGYTDRMRIGTDNIRTVMEHAFPIRAQGFSTIAVSGILSNIANKMLLDGFTAVPQSWRAVAGTRTVTDFKTVTAYRLTAELEYEEVGPTGEIEHGELGQESYTMSAKTYAKMLALTRTDIINDDLGAFNDVRTRLGMGAALKMCKVFWTAWLSASNGAAFWTAARGNLQTGSGLADATIATGVKLFRNMAGPDGNLLNLEPALMLVPPDLEATARKFYVSAELRDTTASTRLAVSNIYQNRFQPVVVPELSNTGYTGYSATTWFLLANPAILASAVMCFLNGVESPTIESADADFNTLGVQFRGYHDFGVAMSEWRASIKSTA